MAIKPDPYVIVFKCTFSYYTCDSMYSYAMKAYSQGRPTSGACSQIPPRTEFDCHYYSMNPSTSGIPIIKKNSFVYYVGRKHIDTFFKFALSRINLFV